MMEGQVKCPETQIIQYFWRNIKDHPLSAYQSVESMIFFFSFIPINGQLVTCIRLIYVKKKGNQSLQPEHIKICKTAKFENRKTYTDAVMLYTHCTANFKKVTLCKL